MQSDAPQGPAGAALGSDTALTEDIAGPELHKADAYVGACEDWSCTRRRQADLSSRPPFENIFIILQLF